MKSRPSRGDGAHPLDRLPEFALGRLDAEESALVRRHLDACDACRTELASWQSVSGAAAAYSAASRVPEGLGGRVLEAVALAADAGAAQRAAEPAMRPSARVRWLSDFVRAQAPLVRREIWPASTIVMFIGAAVSLISRSDGGVPGSALSLLAPLAAAIGIAMIYGQENDPGTELALATPTSPRIVVLARLVVVLAWDLALALAASLVLALIDGPALFLPIVSAWLGPMLLLGCLALLLSLYVHSSLAIGGAAVLWAIRAMGVAGESRLSDLRGLTTALDAFWQTSPLTLALAVCLLAVAVFLTPYREPFAARPSI